MADDRASTERKESVRGSINRYHLTLAGFAESDMDRIGDLTKLTRDQMQQLLHQKAAEIDERISTLLHEKLAKNLTTIIRDAVGIEQEVSIAEGIDFETSLPITTDTDFVVKLNGRNFLAIKLWQVEYSEELFKVFGEVVSLMPTLHTMEFKRFLGIMILNEEVAGEKPGFEAPSLKEAIGSTFDKEPKFDVIGYRVEVSRELARIL